MFSDVRCDLERRLRDAVDESSASERQWPEEYLECWVLGLAFDAVAAPAHAEGARPRVWTTLDEVVEVTGIPDHHPHGGFVTKLVDRISGSQR